MKKVFTLVLALIFLTLSFVSAFLGSKKVFAEASGDNSYVAVGSLPEKQKTDNNPAAYVRSDTTRYIKIGLGVFAAAALGILLTVLIVRKEPVLKEPQQSPSEEITSKE